MSGSRARRRAPVSVRRRPACFVPHIVVYAMRRARAVLIFGFALGFVAGPTLSGVETTRLSPSQWGEARLGLAADPSFEFELGPRRLVVLSVEPEIAVIVRLGFPSKTGQIDFTAPGGECFRLPLFDEVPGLYTLDIKARGPAEHTGVVRVRYEEREFELEDYIDAGRHELARAEQFEGTQRLGALTRALEFFETAGDDLWIGRTLVRLGMATYELGNPRGAARQLQAGIWHLEIAGDDESVAYAYAFLGTVYLLPDRGLVKFFQLLTQGFGAGQPGGLELKRLIPEILGTIDIAKGRRSATSLVEDVFSAALESARHGDHSELEAVLRAEIGIAYLLAAELNLAESYAREALAISKGPGVARGASHVILAGVEFLRGNRIGFGRHVIEALWNGTGGLGALIRTPVPDDALALFNRAVALARSDDPDASAHGIEMLEHCLDGRREEKDLVWQARILAALSAARARASDHALAVRDGAAAIAIWETLGNRVEIASTLLTLGSILAKSVPESGPAAAMLEMAERMFEELRLPHGRARARAALAELELVRERIGPARELLECAVEDLEDIRADVVSRSLRAAFGTAVHEVYERCIQVQIRLNDVHAALLTSELARSRELLDALELAGVDVEAGDAASEPGSDPEHPGNSTLRSVEQDLHELWNVLLHRRLLCLESQQDEAAGRELVAIETKMEQTRRRLDAVESRIRRRLAPRGRLGRWDALRIEPLLERIVDDDTTLLEFDLGDDESHLFVATKGDLRVVRLPTRREIESIAQKLHAALSATTSESEPWETIASELSRLVLDATVTSRLRHRVLVVADGALQYVPFAVLPLPGANGEVLGDRHNVVHIPSALFTGQRSEGSPPPAERSVLALVADPIYSAADDRNVSSSVSDPPGQASRGRLVHSGVAARVIAKMLGSSDVRVILGSEVSRERLKSDRILGARILHFGGHASMDPERAELAGLELSAFDAAGQAVPGILGLQEIYDLSVRSELVVLSACDTASGADRQGEGVVGLATAFLSAGAGSVLGSLWKVDDRATAFLMIRFYTLLLAEGKTPVQALREARKWLRELTRDELGKLEQELGFSAVPSKTATRGVAAPGVRLPAPPVVDPEAPPFSHPYFWAGFVFVDDPDTHWTRAAPSQGE
jgi:CHAT domain-containing protein/tetratricopeptide (TPR) repeat protein